MGKKKLTLEKRQVIEKLLGEGISHTKIAKRVGYNRRSVDNEILRNSLRGCYLAEYAQIQAEQRKGKSRKRRVTENPVVVDFVKKQIKSFSPDAISGRAKLEKYATQVSTESIYQIVYSLGKEFTIHLPSKQPKRKSRKQRSQDARGALKNQVSIDFRPHSIATKRYHGHLEGDTIVGKNHSGAITTLVDKKCRYAMGGLTKVRTADAIEKVINRCLDKSTRSIHTITLDNGKEFANHESFSNRNGIKTYFAHPGCPYQRGQNENFNRILRRYFPKGTDFLKLDPRTVQAVFRRINNTPRRILGYKTPAEVFKKLKVGAILN